MRFLVIGEAGIDVYVYGKVDRLAPDAPVPVVNPRRSVHNAGMAGNVVANLVSLGATSVDSILSDPPITKTRYVDDASGYILLRVDENDRVKEPFAIRELRIRLAGSTFDAVAISDYHKGYLTEDSIAEIINLAHEHSTPVWMDTKKLLGAWSKNVDFVKINRKEHAAQLNGGVIPERYCRNLIVTLGEDGSWWVNEDIRVKGRAVNVSDLSGAGDTAFSALIIEHTRNGGNLVKAMEYANRAAAVAVSKRGVVAVTYDEVE